jgi:hypothetical protein
VHLQDARGHLRDRMRTVLSTGRRAQSQLQRMLVENPLLVGAGALALGAAFGMALPETEREQEMMGQARDAVVDRAQQFVGDAADRVQARASGIADDARQAAESMRRS